MISNHRWNWIAAAVGLTVMMAGMVRAAETAKLKVGDPAPHFTAVVNGPEAVGDKMRYTFERAIGSKG